MNIKDFRIKWRLDWSEDEERGLNSCYRVSEEQERERRNLRDGTSDVLYRLRLCHRTRHGWYLSFGIDYIPNHMRITQFHESIADCWREMLTLGVDEDAMKIIERDICGSDTYADRAPVMLEFFNELCRSQAYSPDGPMVFPTI